MYTVGIDTSHLYLVISLMDEEKTIESYIEPCLKQQSEYLIPKLDELLKKHDLTVDDVEQYVITIGPGSYTGVRIAMTLAKVMGSIVGKKIYTLSTLQLYAGKKDAFVLIDARANRCYVGRYKDGKALYDDKIMTNEEVATHLNDDVTLVGDLHLFDKEDNYEGLADNFFQLKDEWKLLDNVDILTPVYLKSDKEYLKK